mmetsp:Transcript_13370/g.40470  ORF Transcript_13370/g.40470 Transcript_13370/m.40470 type:complete len:105 (+) Transcript_13370:2138-2452(+)
MARTASTLPQRAAVSKELILSCSIAPIAGSASGVSGTSQRTLRSTAGYPGAGRDRATSPIVALCFSGPPQQLLLVEDVVVVVELVVVEVLDVVIVELGLVDDSS